MSSKITRKRRNKLTLDTKIKILREVDKKLKKKKGVALQFGVLPTTLSNIIANREKIEAAALKCTYLKRKTTKGAKHVDLEEQLYSFFCEAQGNDIPMNGPLLIHKARELSLKMGIEGTRFSVGWLWKFKKRYNISTFKTREESTDKHIPESRTHQIKQLGQRLEYIGREVETAHALSQLSQAGENIFSIENKKNHNLKNWREVTIKTETSNLMEGEHANFILPNNPSYYEEIGPFEEIQYLPITLKEEPLLELSDDGSLGQDNEPMAKGSIESTEKSFEPPCKITQLCRLCASQNDSLVEIFGDESQELAVKINNCLPICVSPSDSLPLQVCSSCLNFLNICNNFHSTCVEANLMLKAMFDVGNEEELKDKAKLQINDVLYTSLSTVSMCDMDADTPISEAVEEFVTKPSKEDLMEIESTATVHQYEYKCDICVKVFSCVNSVIKHHKYKHNTFACVKCLELFTEQGSLLKHMGIEHGLKCECCGDCFLSRPLMKKHIVAIHPEFKAHVCVHCSKRFSRKDYLNQHLLSHQTDRPHLCDECGKWFRHISELKIHKKNHLSSEEKNKHKCNLCDKSFSRSYSLVCHKRRHTGEKTCKCPHCPKTFYDRDLLRSHLRAHSQRIECTCPKCGLEFRRKNSLRYHMLRKHVKQWSYKCLVCNKTFATLNLVTSHCHQHTHEEIKFSNLSETIFIKVHNFQCNLCDKVFTNNLQLTAHLKSHTSGNVPSDFFLESSVFCDFCHKIFKNKAVLKRHRRIHTGEELPKPYGCDLCPKRFAQKPNLIHHINAHQGIKPYSCRFCPKSFRTRYRLNVHEKLFHAEEEGLIPDSE